MSLIRTPAHSREELAIWRRLEAQDAAWAESAAFSSRVQSAIGALERFASEPCYVGVSWGKDSTVIAHLAYQLTRRGAPELPLVWVRVRPIEQPDCEVVRDAYLVAQAHDYHEEVVWCRLGKDGSWHASGTLERGFARAAQRLGTQRYVSGVRAEESTGRRRRWERWGHSTARTCAPICDWQARDVWAYLWLHDLPVHPAYACTYNGALDRDRIRVASLGGQRGVGHGRSDWEARYYGNA